LEHAFKVQMEFGLGEATEESFGHGGSGHRNSLAGAKRKITLRSGRRRESRGRKIEKKESAADGGRYRGEERSRAEARHYSLHRRWSAG
jgi:hypothetical protein